MAVTPRRIVAAIALLWLAAFAFLTLYDAVENGVTFLTLVSVAVLVLLGIGIVGALAGRPPDE